MAFILTTEPPDSHNTSMESLISTIVALYTLIFLYFPAIAASPLIISTSLLLLSILRLGAAQRISQHQTEKKKNEKPESDSVVDQELEPDPLQFHADRSVESNVSVLDPVTRPFYGDCFVEWNVRAPLEVIYEAYEGEEEEEEGEYTEEKRDEELRVIERYASLSMYYPETDTDSSSDGDSPVIGEWDSPENMCFRWDDEDREELIEIELDCKRRNSEVEEENLIEIDLLSPANFPVRLSSTAK